MFLHIFKYRFKVLVRNRSTIFWTLIFPIVLATLFSLTFSGLNKQETFNAINVAVINDANYKNDKSFSSVMESLSKGKDKLFELKVIDEAKAKSLLANGSIKAYIVDGKKKMMYVNSSGLSQSIVKSFLDQYSQSEASINRIISENPSSMAAVLNDIKNNTDYLNDVSATNAKPNYTLIYFYSLIAMSCLYGSFFGVSEVNAIQADLSDQAARLNLSPVHKFKAFLSSLTASIVVHFLEMVILLAYMVFVLAIDFGSKSEYVLLTVFVGSFLGISLGAFLSAIIKKNEGIKIAMILGVTMTGSFLSGMMYIDIKYLVSTYLPILAMINPVNLLTDALYALYYYDSYERFFSNLLGLLIFSLIFCLGTYLTIRRRKYASL